MIKHKISFCLAILCAMCLVINIIQKDIVLVVITLFATVFNFMSAFDD